MSNIIKVEDDPSFGRDPNTGAILNLNSDAYHAHMKSKREKESLQNRVENIERDIQDIKAMFGAILSKLEN